MSHVHQKLRRSPSWPEQLSKSSQNFAWGYVEVSPLSRWTQLWSRPKSWIIAWNWSEKWSTCFTRHKHQCLLFDSGDARSQTSNNWQSSRSLLITLRWSCIRGTELPKRTIFLFHCSLLEISFCTHLQGAGKNRVFSSFQWLQCGFWQRTAKYAGEAESVIYPPSLPSTSAKNDGKSTSYKSHQDLEAAWDATATRITS